MQGGQRSAAQVLANSLVGAACAGTAAWLRDGTADRCAAALLLDAAFVAFYGCCTGDTWSSEVSAFTCAEHCRHAVTVLPPAS